MLSARLFAILGVWCSESSPTRVDTERTSGSCTSLTAAARRASTRDRIAKAAEDCCGETPVVGRVRPIRRGTGGRSMSTSRRRVTAGRATESAAAGAAGVRVRGDAGSTTLGDAAAPSHSRRAASSRSRSAAECRSGDMPALGAARGWAGVGGCLLSSRASRACSSARCVTASSRGGRARGAEGEPAEESAECGTASIARRRIRDATTSAAL